MFSAIFNPKSAGNRSFFAVFVHFGWKGGLFATFNFFHHHPLPGHSPHR
jgi:hypothetical protein